MCEYAIGVASLLQDPLTRLVMDADGVTEGAMIALVDQIRRSLAAREVASSCLTRHRPIALGLADTNWSQRMESAAATLEDRIRERAYHLWESSGRPFGRDEEFWLRAREVLVSAAEKAPPRTRRRKRPTPAASD